MADIPQKGFEWFTDTPRRATDRFDDSKLDSFELSIANIRSADNVFVIKKATRELEKGRLETKQVEALFSRAISIRRSFNSPYEDETPYPTDDSKYDDNLRGIEFSYADRYSPVYPGNPIFPKGIRNNEVDEGLLMGMEVVALKAFEIATPEEQMEISKHILKLWPYIDEIDHGTVAKAFLTRIEKSQNGNVILGMFAQKIWDRKEDYTYRLSEGTDSSSGWIDDLAGDLGYYTEGKWLPGFLLGMEGDEDRKRMLGMCVDFMTYPKVINTVREYLNETDDKKAERIGRILIGADPDDEAVNFFTSVEEIYKLIDFEHYPSNEASTQYEANLIFSGLKDGDVVVEKGCGTGRLSNEIASRCVELGLKVKIIAFDASPENIKKAKEDDNTKNVLYFLGSWDQISLENESVNVVVDLGRNNTHAENSKGLDKALEEPARIMKVGARMYGDWPDPNKGEYLENKKRYMKILQSLYIPVNPMNKEQLKDFPYVIDGPVRNDPAKASSGYRYVYNRYVPEMREMARRYGDAGFQTGYITSRKIVGWKNSYNLYFEYTKR